MHLRGLVEQGMVLIMIIIIDNDLIMTLTLMVLMRILDLWSDESI